MEILKDGPAVEQYLNTTLDPELRGLLAERVQALIDYELGEIAHFYVVETADLAGEGAAIRRMPLCVTQSSHPKTVRVHLSELG